VDKLSHRPGEETTGELKQFIQGLDLYGIAKVSNFTKRPGTGWDAYM
jgi:hypothetical protein